MLNLILSIPPLSRSPHQPSQAVKSGKLWFKKISQVIERMLFTCNGLVLKVALRVWGHFSFMYAIFLQLKVRMMKHSKIKLRVLIFILIFKHPGDSSKVGNYRLLERTLTHFSCHVTAQ